MKHLIIGASGFVGGYLVELLQAKTCKVFATKQKDEIFNYDIDGIFDLDILNEDEIFKILDEVKPKYIYHLAAQSSVATSWKKPNITVDINIKGTINLLNAVRKLDYNPRILLVGSSEEYGPVQLEKNPINEDEKTNPANIYAVTKTCQNMIGQVYSKAYNMDIIMTRSFNHIGPRQLPIFVISDFCKQVAEIEKGNQEPIIRVGNLSAKRDFTDVRDIVVAYLLLMEKGKSGETYNIGSGECFEIRELLSKIISLSTKEINVEIDNSRLRPVDVPIVKADISKIKKLGWKKNIDIKNTLNDTLNYWRNN